MKTIFGVYMLAVVNALGYVDPIHVSKSTFLSQTGEIFTGRDRRSNLIGKYWKTKQQNFPKFQFSGS